MFDYEPTSGYVVVPRSTEKLPEDICLIFRYLLFKATYRGRESRNLDIGQIDTTIEQLVKNVKGVRLTEKQMRNRVQKMTEMGMISYQPGRPNVASIVTVLNYADMRNISNYGNPMVTRKEPDGNPMVTRHVNRINSLDSQREPDGNPMVTRKEPGGQPIERIKNKTITNKEEEESLHDSTTTLREELVAMIKKLTGYIAKNRKYKKDLKEILVIQRLQQQYSDKEIKAYWQRFCTLPSEHFKSRPITFPLFEAAIADDYSIIEFEPKELFSKLVSPVGQNG